MESQQLSQHSPISQELPAKVHDFTIKNVELAFRIRLNQEESGKNYGKLNR